jgi:hypothetical protein
MLPKSVDIGQILAVTAVNPALPVAAIGDPREEQAHQTQQFVVGQQYQAQVISQLRDNSFMVNIGGAATNAVLAAAAKPGQILSLTFVGATPKPSFVITPPADTEPGVQTHLSASAVLINQYWDIAKQKGAPPAFEAAAVITPSPHTAPAAMAADLKTALVQSGLFYESHLVNFSLGKQSAASLLIEPQNQAMLPSSLPVQAMIAPPQDHSVPALIPLLQAQVPPLHTPQAAETYHALPQAPTLLLTGPKDQAQPSSPPTLLTSPALPSSPSLPLAIHIYTQLANLIEEPAALQQPAATAFTAPASLPAEISALVPVQLGILEHQGVVWQGQVWPGQELKWEIRRQTPQDANLANDASNQGHDADDMSAIHSQLTLHLPRLGKIVAQLQLQHGNISLKIDAENNSAAAALKQQSRHLLENLENSGQPLSALSVTQHGTAV